MAEQENQVQEDRAKKVCANCGKPTKRIKYYYRNGKFFCGKNCFKLFDKKQNAEKQKRIEEEAKKREEEEKKKPQETPPAQEAQTETKAAPEEKAKE